jgi:exonuclease VII small subunit
VGGRKVKEIQKTLKQAETTSRSLRRDIEKLRDGVDALADTMRDLEDLIAEEGLSSERLLLDQGFENAVAKLDAAVVYLAKGEANLEAKRKEAKGWRS